MVYIVPSVGASVVLLFAVPHSVLGQLWNVIGCHLISAAIGVACYQWLPSYGIAAGASVGLAIGAMYYTRCIHPPGGAKALAGVIGGQNIHALGYRISLLQLQSILQPFSWGYFYLMPCFIGGAILHFCYQKKPKKTTLIANYTHADFVYVLSQIDTFIDVTEDDLLKIYLLATGRGINLNN